MSKSILVENWSKIVKIGRIRTKLGRNSIELVVPEPLGGLPGPNLDQDRPKMDQTKKIYSQKLVIYIAIYTDYILPIYRIYTAYYW